MKISAVLVSIIGTLMLSTFAASYVNAAQLKVEDEIKFRQSGMMFMRWNMANIKQQVVKNPNHYNKDQVIAAANTIAAIANSGLESLFSPQSQTGKGWKKTRLKPEYFDQTDEAAKLIKDFSKEANALANVAHSGDVELIQEQFEILFKACKSCHKKFREKE